MTIELQPELAATLANDVYALTNQPSMEKAIMFLQRKHGNVFDFGNDNVVKGYSGGPGILRCRTAFGFVLLGKGPSRNDAFILFRGTKYLADWLTDFNFTVARSAFGQPVHAGFAQSLRSMRSQLQQFMAQCHGRTVHCIGHSLGGALATVCAEWISHSYGVKSYVYTFGSPRAGLFGFADACTKGVGADRIFRVYHKTDIVPCMPTWPFIHTPNQGAEYFVPSPGVVPWSTYHAMERYYGSVTDHTWSSLKALKKERLTEAGVVQWLKDVKPLAITLTTLEWLNQALLFVLEKCMQGAARRLSHACASGFTILDSIAYILSKGVNVAESVSSWVVFLVRKILVLLGQQPHVDAAELTHQYLRLVLMQLQQRANIVAKQALSQALVKGRAI
jgi:triacylglycerol lipase